MFIDVKVVGMHFRERDGVPAKQIVANMVPPLTLDLEREPENPYDANAIKVICNEKHIGYIEAGQAMWIAPRLDRGDQLVCRVERLETVGRNLHPICHIGPADD